MSLEDVGSARDSIRGGPIFSPLFSAGGEEKGVRGPLLYGSDCEKGHVDKGVESMLVRL